MSRPELRGEVVSLLAAHEDATDFLEKGGPIQGEFLAALDAGASAGHRIGVYRLVEEVGRGGMGTVYRAVRDDDEFQMVVAIKIVSRGMDTDMVLRRFRTERKILGLSITRTSPGSWMAAVRHPACRTSLWSTSTDCHSRNIATNTGSPSPSGFGYFGRFAMPWRTHIGTTLSIAI